MKLSFFLFFELFLPEPLDLINYQTSPDLPVGSDACTTVKERKKRMPWSLKSKIDLLEKTLLLNFGTFVRQRYKPSNYLNFTDTAAISSETWNGPIFQQIVAVSVKSKYMYV